MPELIIEHMSCQAISLNDLKDYRVGLHRQ